MFDNIRETVKTEISSIREEGLYKDERIITSSQQPWIVLNDGSKVLNLCANNYLGLANHQVLIDGAKRGLDKWGYGMASVRFICGTQSVHKRLEDRISRFLGTEDTILYSSCFDANGGLFETLLTNEDAIISDSLNHASIIDGVRLSKAKRYRYENNNMTELEEKLKEASDARFRLIATDGVFSMDGIIANLKAICDLADKYKAMVMVDDSHAVGFIGEKGRGTHEFCDVMGRVDIITGTFGKALGGASGGYTSGRKEIIDLLRQRSRPYLFSNSLAPAIAEATLDGIDLIENSNELRIKLKENMSFFRKGLQDAGFEVPEGNHPIIPIMLGDAKLAQNMARALLDENVYAIGFFFPVVPKGKARIRVQVSAAHTKEDLVFALEAFKKARSAFS